MCFITKFSRIRIATKDIVCYKDVIREKDYCFSRYQKFKYKYNQTYSGKSKWTLFWKWFFNECVKSEGYHSYIHTYYCNVLCIIPKGSLYLIDKRAGEYCSTSIIIKENI